MKLYEVRRKFLDHMVKHGHAEIPSSAIVPQNDPTTLFTGSGMQPMVPYLLGQKHSMGSRITDSQVCFRAEDIEEIGDNRHTTFFEMLGNWSLGDFFKREQIPLMWNFLTEELRLDPSRLYFTCFKGNDELGISRDTESAELWQALFGQSGIDVSIGEHPEVNGIVDNQHIFYYSERKNWWSRVGAPQNMPVGEPGGPDTEMFFDFDPLDTHKIHENSVWKMEPCHVNCDCGRFIEIGNNVFMEYQRTASGYEKLPQQNVDFGGGLERMVAAVNDNPDVFTIDVFEQAMKTLEEKSNSTYSSSSKTTYAMRVVLDHLRGATFLIADGVVPSNKDQGYFTRRLIRRAVRYARDLGIHENFTESVVESYVDVYKLDYPHVGEAREMIVAECLKEESKFRETLEDGIKQFAKGTDPFTLYTTYGFPIEMTLELAGEQGKVVDIEAFNEQIKNHQDESRKGAEQKFKGGLADHGEQTIRLHTAHHLLLAALQKTLGASIHQRGSNITGERLRIDFSYHEKASKEQLDMVEKQVNEWISQKLPVHRIEIPREEAESIGAEMEFGAKYPDMVSVYYVGNNLETAISKEFCGGPHVSNTGELGEFRIQKEEASSNGVRRIKATLV